MNNNNINNNNTNNNNENKKKAVENNQRQLYRELDQEEEKCDYDQSVAEESNQFWRNIWTQSADHTKDAKWLQDLPN